MQLICFRNLVDWNRLKFLFVFVTWWIPMELITLVNSMSMIVTVGAAWTFLLLVSTACIEVIAIFLVVVVVLCKENHAI